MKAIVFPGQGAQFRGIGKDLFPNFRSLTEQASDILGYSIEKLCIDDAEGILRIAQYMQPALHVINAMGFFRRQNEGLDLFTSTYLAGHSLGECNARLAAEAFDFETGLSLVKQRRELMGAARNGGMVAVIGINELRLADLLRDNRLDYIDMANFNTLSQIVISGPQQEIQKAEQILTANNIRCAVLNVSSALHSGCMKEAQQAFGDYLRHHAFGPLRIAVMANVSARPFRDGTVADALAKQIASSVRWCDTIRHLMGAGCKEFVKIGGSVLTRMVDDIRRIATPLMVHEERAAVTASATQAVESSSGARPLAGAGTLAKLTPHTLGSALFRKRYGIQHSYVAGAMYRGIAAPALVVRMGKAGMLGYFGTGGLSLAEIEKGILYIQGELRHAEAYGLNLLANYAYPDLEREVVELYLRRQVRFIEAAAFMNITPALVIFRLKGLRRGTDGKVGNGRRIMAKVSRPEVAEAFMSPAPERIVQQLLAEGRITAQEAELGRRVPISEDVCVEADSGGHTDGGIPTVLFPAMLRLREVLQTKYGYSEPICMGLAGGIGTPEAAAAAFMMGSDFILTGSINQCTVEAGTSDDVKALLQDINVQDTEYAPAGDMFETGARVQVLKKGVLFPTRANKLFSLYMHYNALDEIPEETKRQLETRYFKKTFAQVWDDTRTYFESKGLRHEVIKAEANPKHKMALVFRWYFSFSTQLALSGEQKERVNYQVQTGPALGAFNQWVKGTEMESWANRHADEIGRKLLSETAEYLNRSIARWTEAA